MSSAGERLKRCVTWFERLNSLEQEQLAREWYVTVELDFADLRALLEERDRLAEAVKGMPREFANTHLRAETARLKERLARVEGAARGLKTECEAMLSFCAEDIRTIAGNTNLAVLKEHIQRVAAALEDE